MGRQGCQSEDTIEYIACEFFYEAQDKMECILVSDNMIDKEQKFSTEESWQRRKFKKWDGFNGFSSFCTEKESLTT